MRLIALDTATTVCAVALLEDGRPVVEHSPVLVRTHSQRLMPLIDQALAEAGWSRASLDAVAAGEGPGSFTGVRIGLTTGKALAYALDRPLVTVSTLEAVALSALLPESGDGSGVAAEGRPSAGPGDGPREGDLVCPLLDARRGEVYTALYRVVAPAALRQETPAVSPVLEEWLGGLPAGALWFTGDGAAEHRQRLLQEADRGRRIAGRENLRALAIALLGEREVAAGRTISPLKAVPRYVRRPQAEVIWEQRRSAGTC